MAHESGKPKTLWSETMLEMLKYALKRNKGDKQIKEIARELKTKGYRTGYLIEEVRKELGESQASRLQRLIH